MEKGWIKLFRSIKDHWIYREKRSFSRFEAWVDLLLEANHSSKKFLLGNELVECKRGETISSLRKLSKNWGWSTTKVKNFLKLLEEEGMVTYKSNSKYTHIRIENYDFYQSGPIIEKTEETQEKDSLKSGKITNKNIKNNNNDKNMSLIAPYKRIYQEKIGQLDIRLYPKLKRLAKNYSLELFEKAVDISVKNGIYSIDYIEGILRNWEKYGPRKRLEPRKKARPTRFHNFEQRTSSYTNEELERIMENKRKYYYQRVNLKNP